VESTLKVFGDAGVSGITHRSASISPKKA